MTPCVGFINSVLYVYKGPPLCTKTSGTFIGAGPVRSLEKTPHHPKKLKSNPRAVIEL